MFAPRTFLEIGRAYAAESSRLALCCALPMSGSQLAALGIDAERLGLDENFQAPEALDDLRIDPDDPVTGVLLCGCESRFYQEHRSAGATGT